MNRKECRYDTAQCLTQLLRSTFSSPDPGDGNTLSTWTDVQSTLASMPLVRPTGRKQETLATPAKAGWNARSAVRTTERAITVTVLDSAGATTGTIAFGALAQWVRVDFRGNVQRRVRLEHVVVLRRDRKHDSRRQQHVLAVAPVITGGLTASGSAANDFSGSTGAFKTSTGANTFGGRATFSKSVLRPCQSAVTALGSAAGVITADKDVVLLLSVTTATTYGWTLPTGVAGMVLTLINTAAYANTLIPATGGTINGLAPNAGVVIAASKCYIAVCSAADTWHVMEAAKATAA